MPRLVQSLSTDSSTLDDEPVFTFHCTDNVIRCGDGQPERRPSSRQHKRVTFQIPTTTNNDDEQEAPASATPPHPTQEFSSAVVWKEDQDNEWMQFDAAGSMPDNSFPKAPITQHAVRSTDNRSQKEGEDSSDSWSPMFDDDVWVGFDSTLLTGTSRPNHSQHPQPQQQKVSNNSRDPFALSTPEEWTDFGGSASRASVLQPQELRPSSPGSQVSFSLPAGNPVLSSSSHTKNNKNKITKRTPPRDSVSEDEENSIVHDRQRISQLYSAPALEDEKGGLPTLQYVVIPTDGPETVRSMDESDPHAAPGLYAPVMSNLSETSGTLDMLSMESSLLEDASFSQQCLPHPQSSGSNANGLGLTLHALTSNAMTFAVALRSSLAAEELEPVTDTTTTTRTGRRRGSRPVSHQHDDEEEDDDDDDEPERAEPPARGESPVDMVEVLLPSPLEKPSLERGALVSRSRSLDSAHVPKPTTNRVEERRRSTSPRRASTRPLRLEIKDDAPMRMTNGIEIVGNGSIELVSPTSDSSPHEEKPKEATKPVPILKVSSFGSNQSGSWKPSLDQPAAVSRHYSSFTNGEKVDGTTNHNSTRETGSKRTAVGRFMRRLAPWPANRAKHSTKASMGTGPEFTNTKGGGDPPMDGRPVSPTPSKKVTLCLDHQEFPSSPPPPKTLSSKSMDPVRLRRTCSVSTASSSSSSSDDSMTELSEAPSRALVGKLDLPLLCPDGCFESQYPTMFLGDDQSVASSDCSASAKTSESAVDKVLWQWIKTS